MKYLFENSIEGSLSGFSGSLETWASLITDKLPKLWTYFSKTVLPLIDASLIQLFGAYDKFEKIQGDISFSEDYSSLSVMLIYSIPELKGISTDQDSELSDRNYLLKKLGVLAPTVTINLNQIRFDSKTGYFRINFNTSLEDIR